VFENRVLRRIFGSKREEVAGGWRRMHSEELHKLYASSNVKAINSKRERLARHVERIGEIRNACKIWSENLKERDHLEELDVDERIILE
jgi:hypothetical protein